MWNHNQRVLFTENFSILVKFYIIEAAVVDKSFGGMKKGFFNSSSTVKPKSDEIIEISSKKAEPKKDFRVFDEVQQVIKEEQQSKSKII